MKVNPIVFPKTFVWGVAAAATQIEGGCDEGGKGESNWDHFSRMPGKIRNGDRPSVACDHYHRYREDFALMRELGIRHYRLSLAWPRIYPEGTGRINPQGIDFYKRLLDVMGEEGITPWVTMFHWDLPQVLEERGGWRSRETVDSFARYADTIVQEFGGRVSNWITLNEIVAFTRNAYGIGRNAPGLRESDCVVNQAYHHALLCHGHGVRAVREYGAPGSRVGLADNPRISIPVTETEADIRAAEILFQEDNVRIWDPMCRGGYTELYHKIIGEQAPEVGPGDFDLIAIPADFLGLNVYAGAFVREGKNGRPERLSFPENYPKADSDWYHITPQAIYWALRLASCVYGFRSLYITENGCGYINEQVIDGECLDLHRRDLLRNYLREMNRAIEDGIPVGGYFLWSFMDNFEWGDGYRMRFGICHTDYHTLRRTPKLSARWYAAVIRENRLL